MSERAGRLSSMAFVVVVDGVDGELLVVVGDGVGGRDCLREHCVSGMREIYNLSSG